MKENLTVQGYKRSRLWSALLCQWQWLADLVGHSGIGEVLHERVRQVSSQFLPVGARRALLAGTLPPPAGEDVNAEGFQAGVQVQDEHFAVVDQLQLFPVSHLLRHKLELGRCELDRGAVVGAGSAKHKDLRSLKINLNEICNWCKMLFYISNWRYTG